MEYQNLVRSLRARIPGLSSINAAPATVTGVTHDSRNVKPGFLFAALPGAKSDGTAFVADAVARGAVAILTDRKLPDLIPQIVSKSPRRAMGMAAALVAGQPTHSLTVAGVTGTSGKTTSAFLLRSMFEQAGKRSGLIGTVEVDTLARRFPAEMTTPEAPDLQSWFAEMLASGASAAAMEVSSHALCQDRCAGIDFAAGLFTNLSQDHLDYHETLDAYFEAKARLFEMLSPRAAAVANIDDPRGLEMLRRTKARRISFGFSDQADVRITGFSMSVEGMTFALESRRWGVLEFETPLTGRFNAHNIAGAATVALALGIPAASVLEATRTATGAPGRLERVSIPNAANLPSVFVDYAHKPDALEKAAETMRAVCSGRKLVTIFGCGGDRDRTKRPKMGAIAERLSDAVVVTSDNPRTENADAIIREVLAGMSTALPANQSASPTAPRLIVEPDRAAAIRAGIRLAGPGGVVLLAGKGHEDYQIVGKEKRHFDDREQARIALLEISGQSAPTTSSAPEPAHA
jgi:UDP-N-acetylmuramoyl-L-alanyl-D-glutamate--2,6-diaminopimelate ligase